MALKEQILTIILSIIYGFFFYLMIYLNKKILFQKNVFKRIISNILFIIDMILIYFVMIRYINNAVLTYYSYLFIIIGILLQKIIFIKMKKK